jgi:hypothetical protein
MSATNKQEEGKPICPNMKERALLRCYPKGYIERKLRDTWASPGRPVAAKTKSTYHFIELFSRLRTK